MIICYLSVVGMPNIGREVHREEPRRPKGQYASPVYPPTHTEARGNVYVGYLPDDLVLFLRSGLSTATYVKPCLGIRTRR